MTELKQTLDSREVAEMVEKNHKDLMRDIKRYIRQMDETNERQDAERKIAPSDFFKESEYKDSTGRTLPCYRITKKGCEFIAHKLTGTKGTIFTARYINRFHEMEEIIKKQPVEQGLPWFIRKFQGSYIMLFRDFESITGIHLLGNYTSMKRNDRLVGGRDYNGWGWKCDNEKFREEYGFDYGDDNCMTYLYPCGIIKAMGMADADPNASVDPTTYGMLRKWIGTLEKPGAKKIEVKKPETEGMAGRTVKAERDLPITINIVYGAGSPVNLS